MPGLVVLHHNRRQNICPCGLTTDPLGVLCKTSGGADRCQEASKTTTSFEAPSHCLYPPGHVLFCMRWIPVKHTVNNIIDHMHISDDHFCIHTQYFHFNKLYAAQKIWINIWTGLVKFLRLTYRWRYLLMNAFVVHQPRYTVYWRMCVSGWMTFAKWTHTDLKHGNECGARSSLCLYSKHEIHFCYFRIQNTEAMMHSLHQRGFMLLDWKIVITTFFKFNLIFICVFCVSMF